MSNHVVAEVTNHHLGWILIGPADIAVILTVIYLVKYCVDSSFKIMALIPV